MRPYQCPSAAGVASADHLLTLTFQPGMTRLATAALVPDSADISDAVCEFRKAQNEADADLPLSLLVSLLAHQVVRYCNIISLAARYTGAVAHSGRHLMAQRESSCGLLPPAWTVSFEMICDDMPFVYAVQVQDVQKRIAETLKIQAAVAKRIV